MQWHILVLSFLLLCSQSVFAEWGMRGKLRELREARQAEAVAPIIPGDFKATLKYNNRLRDYMVHVPASYDSTHPVPLVISMHGGGGNMQYQATDQFYHLISASDKYGYIIVFPNGYSRLPGGKLATWNAGICCGKARDTDSDDTGFIKALIEVMQSRAAIDTKRIYANGMSNGGMMAYRLACELSDTIAAIAAVAGTDGTKGCSPGRAVPILHIHALDDDHVFYNGGSGVKFEPDTHFTSVPDTVAKWVKLNGCKASAERVLQVSGAYCDLYSGCREDAQVKLCVTETGGHTWPGGQSVRGREGTKSINANDLMWEFFVDNPMH